MRKELVELARKLRVQDRVRFAGFLAQAQLREAFYQSHIFLHPSELGADGNQEGVPNSMLEAMASGLPVFATHHGGIPEAIEHGRSGVLVGERDHTALAAALLEWTKRPEDLARLAQDGARAVAAKFEQRAQVRALEDFYLEAIGRTG
jgi:glycosyltransferase involved in cell wall biosynthesis